MHRQSAFLASRLTLGELRQIVPGCWWSTGADPVAPGPSLGSDDRTISWHQAGFGQCAERRDQANARNEASEEGRFYVRIAKTISFRQWLISGRVAGYRL